MDPTTWPPGVVWLLGALALILLAGYLGALLGAWWREQHPHRPTRSPQTAAGAGDHSHLVPAAPIYGRHAKK